jgi:hypothetical protein
MKLRSWQKFILSGVEGLRTGFGFRIADFGILTKVRSSRFSEKRKWNWILIKSARGGELLSVGSLASTLTLAGISNIFKENLAFTGA